MISIQQLSDCYQQACEVELQAFKPGNVSVYADGHDMVVDDFRLSAKVSAAPLVNPDYCLGEKIYYAVKATREAVGCNTNLGILLLCAPLVEAAVKVNNTASLQQALSSVLANTTVNDADWVFQAISLASPGGLGSSEQQDVKTQAEITLTAAMKIAENRDRIAFQYNHNFKDIFDFALLRYNVCFNRWSSSCWAALAVYSGLLSRYPDSHIERKYGNKYTRMVATKMTEIDNLLMSTDNPTALEAHLFEIDADFKSAKINPGTSADMTVTTVFVAFLENALNS